MSPMQKHNRMVDKIKDKWALLHGIPLIRIWEIDIRKNPQEVLTMLKKRLYLSEQEDKQKKKKNSRHINKLKK